MKVIPLTFDVVTSDNKNTKTERGKKKQREHEQNREDIGFVECIHEGEIDSTNFISLASCLGI